MAEETLHDSEAMRRLAGIEPGDDRIPDETTILNFRHLLERHGLAEAIFADLNAHLADRGITLRSGTLVDATIIDAPSSTKTRAVAREIPAVEAPAPEAAPEPVPETASAPEAVAPAWRDEVNYALAPGEGIEIKLVMQEGETAEFEWTANGATLNYTPTAMAAETRSATNRAARFPIRRAPSRQPSPQTMAGSGETAPLLRLP